MQSFNVVVILILFLLFWHFTSTFTEYCIHFTEQFENAVEDLRSCLAIQQSILDPEDRCLAETHYQLGLAHTSAEQYDDAVSNFKDAVAIIEAKIELLEKVSKI